MSSLEGPTSSMWAVQPSSDRANISTEQLTDFHRIPVVIVNTGSRVLRKILSQKLPPGQDLRAFLKSNNSELEKLHTRRVITALQMDLLQNDCPDLENFDVTLLFCLLRNIVNVQAPATGWRTQPDPSDTSLGADLVRIRNWQNRINSPADEMKNKEINHLWNEVEAVLVRMTPEGEERNYIQQEIADGKQRFLDTVTEKEKHLCDILVKWYKSTFEDVDTKDVMNQLAGLQLDDTSMRREQQADATDARLAGENLGNVKMSPPLEKAKRGTTFNERPDGKQQSSPVRTNIGGFNSQNFFGSKVKFGQVTFAHGTGNSSTNRTVPDYEHDSGTRIDNVNYGASYGQNFFNSDVEHTGPLLHTGGDPEAKKNTNSSASGGYDEIDTVPIGSTTSLSGDFKVEHDNTLSEEMHDPINLSLKSVGMLRIADSSGTAFRVGSKYAMTAWNVIRDCVGPLKNGQRDFPNLERCNAFINFNADPYSPNHQIFYISSTVPYFDIKLDIAVVELKTNNSINLPPALPLCSEHETFKNVNKLKVLGFGHPESVKKRGEFATVILPGSPRVKAALDWVQQKEEKLKPKCRAMGKDPESFTWDYRGCDDDKNVTIDMYKEKGSSGSPALICADATKVKVMAVVYRGLPDCVWELQSTIPAQYRMVLAVKMSHIYVSMHNKNATLKNDVF